MSFTPKNVQLPKKLSKGIKSRKPIKNLKKKLDSVFSLYIRTRDSGICYTCGIKKPVKQVQNGHYISRSKLATRFDEINCHCQCVGCNVFKNGNYPVYANRLVRNYGQGVLESLELQGNMIVKYTNNWYQIKIDYYNKLLKEYDNN